MPRGTIFSGGIKHLKWYTIGHVSQMHVPQNQSGPCVQCIISMDFSVQHQFNFFLTLFKITL
jgi:hypothetical protein